MSAYIKNLTNSGNKVYPKTKMSAVYYKDGTSLSTVLDTKINKTDVYTKQETLDILTVDEEEEI